LKVLEGTRLIRTISLRKELIPRVRA